MCVKLGCSTEKTNRLCSPSQIGQLRMRVSPLLNHWWKSAVDLRFLDFFFFKWTFTEDMWRGNLTTRAYPVPGNVNFHKMTYV